MKNIAIIGGGNMGEALIKGLHQSHVVSVVEANAPRVAYLKKKYDIKILDLSAAVRSAGVIILAVKPQDMSVVLEDIKKNCKPSQLVVSIAAGLTTKFFEKALAPANIAVVRSMPNMPALIAEGITGLSAGRYAKPADIKTAQKILNTIGQTVIVKESMIDALTAVSGSGPAYVFLLVEGWMNAAKALGFKEEEAKALVYQTLIGSANLLKQSTFSAGELRLKVTSKGGTTQAAMDVFFKGKIDYLIKQALLAAKKRAKELAK